MSFKKLRKRLLRQVDTAINQFGMTKGQTLGARPKWLVCLSGGKDSYSLLTLLLDLQSQGRLDVDLLPCNLDQGQPGFPQHILPDWLSALGVDFRIEYKDTYSVVTEKVPENKTFCGLCSRLRRGHLYRIAREEKCDAIVLGHHQDDAVETYMLNMLYGGHMAAMPPKLRNDEGDLLVLRPLIHAIEDDIERYAKAMNFPIIPCNLCGSQDGLQRQSIKALLSDWETRRPGTKANIARSLAHIRPSHMLDDSLFDFKNL